MSFVWNVTEDQTESYLVAFFFLLFYSFPPMDLPAVQLLCLEGTSLLGGPHLILFGFGIQNLLSGPRHASQWNSPLLSWCKCWWTTIRHSPSASWRRIAPAPLQILSPACHCTEQSLEPTADGELKPASTRGSESSVTLEPKPDPTSDQVCELATLHIPERVLVE